MTGKAYDRRLQVVLACPDCKTRNYKTTKSIAAEAAGPLELKKFCRVCKKHTIHRETK